MKFPIKSFSIVLVIISSCQSPQTMNTHDKLIFKDSSGHIINEADLVNFTGQVKYELLDEKTISPAAAALHQEARAFGQAGKYDLSIAKLEQAMAMEPDWAYPVYDLAFTYLLKGDFSNALKYYKQTNALSPQGFFTVKTALYTLEGEEKGIFPKGMYLGYLQIEWADTDAKKLAIAKMIVEKIPGFAPAWKELALLQTNNTEKEKAIEQGLSGNPDADTKGVLLINKAILLNDQGKKEAAVQLLGNLIFSPDTTVGNIALAKFTLKSIANSGK
jgi:tetratricopeptide (TPR) repeat protein